MQPGRSASASDREQAGLDEPERPESRSHAERGNENVSDVSFDFQFALIRRYLRAHLTQRTEQGLWDFTHAQARMSVLNSRLADPAYFKQCHCRMADYLESLPREDPLRITERMYHLIAADEKEKAAQLYGSLMLLLNDAEGKACTKALVENMLRQGEEGWAWVESLLDFARNSQDEKLSHRLCTRFNFDLSDELKYQVTLGPRIRLLEANKSCLEAFCAQFPDNADFARDLSVSYGKIGDLFLQSGKQEIALQYFEKCNTLFEELRTRTPDSADFARNFAVSHYKLAGYYQEKEEYERMLEHFQKFLDIGHEMEERGMFVDAPLKRAMEQIRAALAQISEL
jgi:tetratricopeptide (TPR) repeat protein